MQMRGTALAVLIAAGGALCAAGHAAALEKVKVTLAAASNNYAPVFNAIEEGYYKDEGLEVEIVGAAGGVATPALLSGQVEFSTSAASAFSAILRGGPLKVVLTEADRPVYQLWSTKPELKTVRSLKGKTIGVQTRGDTVEIWLRLVLKAHGMGGDDVVYSPLGYGAGRIAALKSGSLPAVVAPTLDVMVARDSGVKLMGHMLEDSMTDKIRMPYNGVATSDAVIKDKPKLVQSFVRATLKGMRFMKANKEKTVDNVLKYYKKDRRSIAVDYNDVVKTLTKDGTVPASVQAGEAEIRAALLKLPKDKIPPLKSMFDFTFVRKANKSLDAEGWKPTS
jgi:ABC-type nitrate/sulfonate/bicarbonate transport system substrate-binding protein